MDITLRQYGSLYSSGTLPFFYFAHTHNGGRMAVTVWTTYPNLLTIFMRLCEQHFRQLFVCSCSDQYVHGGVITIFMLGRTVLPLHTCIVKYLHTNYVGCWPLCWIPLMLLYMYVLTIFISGRAAWLLNTRIFTVKHTYIYCLNIWQSCLAVKHTCIYSLHTWQSSYIYYLHT